MARPRKVGMDYFPHDVDAATDEKISALRNVFGNDGYTFFFVMCERIYRCEFYEYDLSHEQTRITAAKLVDVSIARFNEMIEASVQEWCGLFDAKIWKDRKCLTSEGIKKRTDFVESRRVPKKPREEKHDSPPDNPPSQKEIGDVAPVVEPIRTGEITIPEKLLAVAGFKEAWGEWLEYRKEANMKCTPRAMKMQLSNLEKWDNPIQVIQKSIANNYAGLFELTTNGKHPQSPALASGEKVEW